MVSSGAELVQDVVVWTVLRGWFEQALCVANPPVGDRLNKLMRLAISLSSVCLGLWSAVGAVVLGGPV